MQIHCVVFLDVFAQYGVCVSDKQSHFSFSHKICVHLWEILFGKKVQIEHAAHMFQKMVS